MKDSMPELRSNHLFTLTLDVDPNIVDLGETPYGRRRIASVTGGTFEGEEIRGTVLPTPGGDWLLLRRDGILMLNVRLTLKTDDGHLIYMHYEGMRHGPAWVIEALNKGEKVEPVSKDGKTFYRAYVTGFAGHDAAQAFCEKLKAAGKACFVK